VTDKEFDVQVARLSDQWPRAYEDERKAAFWSVFKSVGGDVFKDAVTDCLLRYRQAPMIEELQEAVGDVEKRVAASRSASSVSPLSVLKESAEKQAASKEYAKLCIQAIQYKISKNLNSESDEWKKILNTLDRAANANRPPGICRTCENLGVAYRIEKKHGNEYQYAYRCYCDAGLRQTRLPPLPGFRVKPDERERVPE
jgi:hypothetical protein